MFANMGSSKEDLENLDRELLDLKNFLDTKQLEIFNRSIILSNDMYYHWEMKRKVDLMDYKLQLHKADLTTKKRQNSLSNVARILGIKQKEDENNESLLNVVLAVLQRRFCVTLAKEDLDFCYRIVFSDSGEPCKQPRPVIVHFKSPEIQSNVIENCKRKHNSRYQLFPELCEERNQVRSNAKKVFGKQNVFNIKGSIYVQLPDGSKKEFSTTKHLEGHQRGYPEFPQPGKILSLTLKIIVFCALSYFPVFLLKLLASSL